MVDGHSGSLRKWSVALLLLLAVLPMYLLSSGPAAWLLPETEFGLATWNTLYRPAGWLAERTGAERPYVRYVRWWATGD